MGVIRVLQGMGKGSFFGYGRVCGVHNPFSSKLSKARDPFINHYTLARLSREENDEVRGAVVDNLASRLSVDILLRTPLFPQYESDVLNEAISRADLDREPLRIGLLSILIRDYPPISYDREVRSAVLKAIKPTLKPEELARLAKSWYDDTVRMVASHPNTPKNTLFWLADKDLYDAGRVAFETLYTRFSLTSRELGILARTSANGAVRGLAARKTECPLDAVAAALSARQKSGETHEEYDLPQPSYENTGLYITTYNTSSFYTEEDVQWGREILLAHEQAKRSEILRAMTNKEYARLLAEGIQP